jgi:polyhydroxyalkanoate synthesis regulator phasin
MRDAVRGYLALATGLTEVTRARATAAAKTLVAQGEATAEQVQSIALDLVATSQSNRAALIALVRYEVDRTMSRLGLATAEETAATTARLSAVEAQLRELRAAVAAADTPSTAPRRSSTGPRDKRAPAKAAKSPSTRGRSSSPRRRTAAPSSARKPS